ncbi:SCP2 sterol-binding domain-containing protein [Conexibacter sp. SYSU D00693]|uniref:SCP2 sterol-binding domain-containing protein n=1 Tax=Conexibacter sp. SYSU D00693 TaxID=2812560 RepID=UPI00196A8035|nr:SCP2 sterol-binding domain-containing protein [Conexibacter sp. SYSU D00693]
MADGPPTAVARPLRRGLARSQRRVATEFVRRVRSAPRERLDALDGVTGRALLVGVFRAAPSAFRRGHGPRETMTVEFRIGEADGGASVHTLVLDRDRCRVKHGIVAEPDLVLEVGIADFLRLVVGEEDAGRLVFDGRLKVRGDLWLAMRLPRMFVVRPSSRPGT